MKEIGIDRISIEGILELILQGEKQLMLLNFKD